MQTSVAGELRWKLALFQKSFAFCRQGGFSFARFLALVPDRLRLASGDRGQRVRIPMQLDPALLAALKNDFRSEGEAPALSKASVRRVVRWAQLDPALEPRALAAWEPRGELLLQRLVRLYQRGLAEIGRGSGGEETAYLVHLLIQRALAEVAPIRPAGAVLAAAWLGMAQRALSQTGTENVPLRLVYQLAATTSPWALGATDSVAERPVNMYRTLEPVVRLARRVLPPPVELVPLGVVVDTLKRRVELDPELRSLLLKDLLLERVRDVALVQVLQDAEPGPLAELVGSPKALVQHVFNQRRRTALLGALGTGRILDSLRGLLEGASQIEAGDPTPLGVHGDLGERAQLAAEGAVVLVLEEHTHQLQRDVTALLTPVTEGYEAGQAYLLADDPRPLYRLRASGAQAQVAVQLSAVIREVHQRRPAGAAAFVMRTLLSPLLSAAKQVGLEVLSAASDRLLLQGDVLAAVGFAERATEVVAELEASLSLPVSDILGGAADEREAQGELRRLDARLGAVEGALERIQDPEAVRLLSDEKRLLSQQSQWLAQLRQTSQPLALGIAVGFGPQAERLGEGLWWAPDAPRLLEWTQAPRVVAAQRTAQLRKFRIARADPSLDHAFRAGLQTLDGEPRLYNGGCVVTQGALEALEAAKTPGLVFEERVLQVRALPEVLRGRYVFEREQERLRLGWRPRDPHRAATEAGGECVAMWRYLGELGEPLWELVAQDRGFGADLTDWVQSTTGNEG